MGGIRSLIKTLKTLQTVLCIETDVQYMFVCVDCRRRKTWRKWWMTLMILLPTGEFVGESMSGGWVDKECVGNGNMWVLGTYVMGM